MSGVGRRRRGWVRDWRVWVAAGLLVVVVVVLVVVVAGRGETPRARQYRDVTACLLTDARGVAGAEAAPVWAGMQEASLTTRAKVQFLEVDGPETVDNARTYLGSLVLSRCDVVVAVGAAQVGAVAIDAPAYPEVQFVAVGEIVPGDNVSHVAADGPQSVTDAVARIVAETVG